MPARLLYPGKLLVTIKGEREIFHGKNKVKKFLFGNLALQKTLEGNVSLKRMLMTQGVNSPRTDNQIS